MGKLRVLFLCTGNSARSQMSFPDPAAAQGGEAAKLRIFQQVRDAIQQQVLDFLVQWKKDTPKVYLS
ncbi:MAG: hypothetical protein JW892_17175 [Anaerolineae bacterium]|nr:hypothetical protein [Anaerolineae bacterium]